MSIDNNNAGPSHGLVEAGLAVLIGSFGVVVIIGSVLAGTGWGSDGPRAGFFPFWIGVAIVLSSIVNLWQARRDITDTFALWVQLRHVVSVALPTAIYVGAIPFVGLYLASALFIAWFMRVLGRYRWPLVLAVALGTPLVTYLVFERWFLVPLPKGPLEEWLGL